MENVTNSLLTKILTVLEKQEAKKSAQVRYIDEVVTTNKVHTSKANTVSYKNQGNITVYVDMLRLEPGSGMVTFGNETPEIDITDRRIKFDFTDVDSEPTPANQKPALYICRKILANSQSTFEAIEQQNNLIND